jgi:hypothetical protein
MRQKPARDLLVAAALLVFLSLQAAGAAEKKDASPLSIAPGANKAIATVALQNDVPIRGVQFTVEGALMTEVRTTQRTGGFIVKFNEKNGKVLIVSASGDDIAPGKGPIADIVCDKPDKAKLLNVKVVARGTDKGPKAGAPAPEKPKADKQPAQEKK